jgi:hypothetical protein
LLSDVLVGLLFLAAGVGLAAVFLPRSDPMPTRGWADELGKPVFLQTIADSRKTIALFGSGYLEMIARQMPARLQSIRDNTPPRASRELVDPQFSSALGEEIRSL